MLGKASEIGIAVFSHESEYHEWRKNFPDNIVVDVKVTLGEQSFNFQHNYAITIIYKEDNQND